MQVTFSRVSEKIFAVESTPQFIVVGMTEARVLSEPLQRFFGESDSEGPATVEKPLKRFGKKWDARTVATTMNCGVDSTTPCLQEFFSLTHEILDHTH